MITFTEKFSRMFLMVMNGIFVGMGVSMIVLGIYQVATASKIVGEMDEKPSHGVTIIAGCFDLVIGACGLVGALLNKRVLLLANAGMLTAAVLGNSAAVIFYSIDLSSTTAAIRTSLKDLLVEQYGNNTVADSKELTLQVDEYHKMDGCCGWGGLESENLFLKTPWYRAINANPVGEPLTLPDSCCVKAGDKCHRTTNVKQARDEGYVYRFDCADRIVGRLTVLVGLFLAQLALVTLMQIACLVFSVIYLMQQPTLT